MSTRRTGHLAGTTSLSPLSLLICIVLIISAIVIVAAFEGVFVFQDMKKKNTSRASLHLSSVCGWSEKKMKHICGPRSTQGRRLLTEVATIWCNTVKLLVWLKNVVCLFFCFVTRGTKKQSWACLSLPSATGSPRWSHSPRSVSGSCSRLPPVSHWYTWHTSAYYNSLQCVSSCVFISTDLEQNDSVCRITIRALGICPSS